MQKSSLASPRAQTPVSALATGHPPLRRPAAAEPATPSLGGLLGQDLALPVLTHLGPTDPLPPHSLAQIREQTRDIVALSQTSRTLHRWVRQRGEDTFRQFTWSWRHLRFTGQAIEPLLDPALTTPVPARAAPLLQRRLELLLVRLVASGPAEAIAPVVASLFAHASTTNPVDVTQLGPCVLAVAARQHRLQPIAPQPFVRVVNAHFSLMPPHAQAACFLETGVLVRHEPALLDPLLETLAQKASAHPSVFGPTQAALLAALDFLTRPGMPTPATMAAMVDPLLREDVRWGAADLTVLMRLAALAAPPHGVPTAVDAPLRSRIVEATARCLAHLCRLHRHEPHIGEHPLVSMLAPGVLWDAIEALDPEDRRRVLTPPPGGPSLAERVPLIRERLAQARGD